MRYLKPFLLRALFLLLVFLLVLPVVLTLARAVAGPWLVVELLLLVEFLTEDRGEPPGRGAGMANAHAGFFADERGGGSYLRGVVVDGNEIGIVTSDGQYTEGCPGTGGGFSAPATYDVSDDNGKSARIVCNRRTHRIVEVTRGLDPMRSDEGGHTISWNSHEAIAWRKAHAAVTIIRTANGQFSAPAGIAIDKNDNVWVVDSGNNRLEEFSDDGAFIRSIGGKGFDDGQFYKPHGVSVDRTGTVWVADTGNARVEWFSGVDGAFVGRFSVPSHEPGQFDHPSDVCVDPRGNVWVTDSTNEDVEEFEQSGRQIKAIGTQFDHRDGKTDRMLFDPWGIACDSDGSIWVTFGHDQSDGSVLKLRNDGAWLQQIDASMGLPHGFTTEGLAIVPNDGIWVAGGFVSIVQKFGFDGRRLQIIGATSEHEGPQPPDDTRLSRPVGVAVDKSGRLWVTDSGDNVIEIYDRAGNWLKTIGDPYPNCTGRAGLLGSKFCPRGSRD